MKIDAHQHYWQPARGDYDWMPPQSAVLNRPYGPADLAPELTTRGVQGTVLVQAAATVSETEYMLGIADATDTVLGVVGWIDFEDPRHLRHLDRFAAHPKFLGVRPMIQDIPDLDWMLRDDLRWAFEALIDLDLTFDALGYPQHLPNFLTLMKRYPDLRVVYDHCMKPQIRDARAGGDAFAGWADGIALLASETEGSCKFSGLVTEAGDDWTVEDLRPFARHVLSCFGPDRVMWGSDWPVCRLRAEYGTWLQVSEELTDHLSADQKAAVFGGNAMKFYGLEIKD